MATPAKPLLEIRDVAGSGSATATLELPFELRQRSRLRASLDDGESVAVLLPRGTVMRDGMLLRTTDGRLVAVLAAHEDVSTVAADEAVLLARIAFHLGNRHVRLQIGEGFVRYPQDRVLDDLVTRLGATVVVESAPFEPESGAYERTVPAAEEIATGAHG
jgi:urease accessory protein